MSVAIVLGCMPRIEYDHGVKCAFCPCLFCSTDAASRKDCSHVTLHSLIGYFIY
jgi:hypothetical protein